MSRTGPDHRHRPSITTVIATKDRPRLLRRTLRSVLAQDYVGQHEVIVVFDQAEIDPLEDVLDGTPVRIHRVLNTRTPGLTGGRNTGIAHSTSDLIAFCDDDDEWLPSKLSRQVDLWFQHPEAAAVSCGITIDTGKRSYVQIPRAETGRSDFLADRVSEIHTSSLLMRRSDLATPDGFADERLPASYGEDYDMLLRLSARGPIVSVPEPLAVIHWDRPSFFAEKWRGLAAGLTYLLEKHPDLSLHRRNAARMRGQIAFAHAAAGNRAAARHWTRESWRGRRLEPRAWAALAVSSHMLSPGLAVQAMNKLGRGL